MAIKVEREEIILGSEMAARQPEAVTVLPPREGSSLPELPKTLFTRTFKGMGNNFDPEHVVARAQEEVTRVIVGQRAENVRPVWHAWEEALVSEARLVPTRPFDDGYQEIVVSCSDNKDGPRGPFALRLNRNFGNGGQMAISPDVNAVDVIPVFEGSTQIGRWISGDRDPSVSFQPVELISPVILVPNKGIVSRELSDAITGLARAALDCSLASYLCDFSVCQKGTRVTYPYDDSGYSARGAITKKVSFRKDSSPVALSALVQSDNPVFRRPIDIATAITGLGVPFRLEEGSILPWRDENQVGFLACNSRRTSGLRERLIPLDQSAGLQVVGDFFDRVLSGTRQETCKALFDAADRFVNVASWDLGIPPEFPVAAALTWITTTRSLHRLRMSIPTGETSVVRTSWSS